MVGEGGWVGVDEDGWAHWAFDLHEVWNLNQLEQRPGEGIPEACEVLI